MRLRQWLKNALVFGPLIFADAFGDSGAVLRTLACFAAMCLLSSSTYVFNDIVDIARDRSHPKKRLRPVASGQVSVRTAIFLGLILLAIGLVTTFWLGRTTFAIACLYLLLQIFYNLRLKQVAIADAFLIATGFVLRPVIGAAAIDVRISGWLLFCTGALALMFAFAKRRSEFIGQGEERGLSRESLLGYTQPSLDALFLLSAVASLTCYGIYSLESHTARTHPSLILTTVFVAYAVCRYIHLVYTTDGADEPELLLVKDRQLLLCIVLFLLASLWVMRNPTLPLIEGYVPDPAGAVSRP